MKSASPDSAQSDPALSISPEEMQNSSSVEEDQSTHQNSNTVPDSVHIQGDQDSPPKCIHFSLEKHFSIKMDTAQWRNIFLWCSTNKRNEKVLPPNWTDLVAEVLYERIPPCSINFKRHKLYCRTSNFFAKFWFHCSIEGCSLNSNAILDKKYVITCSQQ